VAIRSLGVSLGIIQRHPHTSLSRVCFGLPSAPGTAAYPARAFLGLCHGSFPVLHISSLPHIKFPLAVVFIASMLPGAGSAGEALASHQDCPFLGGRGGSRANGRLQRRQMQESNEVTLLHEYLIILGCLCSQGLLCRGSGNVADVVAEGSTPSRCWETPLSMTPCCE